MRDDAHRIRLQLDEGTNPYEMGQVATILEEFKCEQEMWNESFVDLPEGAMPELRDGHWPVESAIVIYLQEADTCIQLSANDLEARLNRKGLKFKLECHRRGTWDGCSGEIVCQEDDSAEE
jgi:hypothetical protein